MAFAIRKKCKFRKIWPHNDLLPHQHNFIWGFLYCIHEPSLVPIELQLYKLGQIEIFSLFYNLTSYNLWPWCVTFDLINIWGFLYYIHKPSLVPIGLQLFKLSQIDIFSLFYNLTSYDLWPLHVTFDHTHKCKLPCCTHDPRLVEIHRSMQNLEANVNPFHDNTDDDADDPVIHH